MPHIGNFPAPGYPKPLSINPCAFRPEVDTYDYTINQQVCRNQTSLTEQYFFAPVYLPHGATVTKFTFYGYRDDVLSTMRATLQKVNRPGVVTTLAEVIADWTIGESSGYDDTILQPVIDNENYSYIVRLFLDPNDDVMDCYGRAMVIDWQ